MACFGVFNNLSKVLAGSSVSQEDWGVDRMLKNGI
jgi:hypothetical protein